VVSIVATCEVGFAERGEDRCARALAQLGRRMLTGGGRGQERRQELHL
jgi:hypothetical protein